jgi:integrase
VDRAPVSEAKGRSDRTGSAKTGSAKTGAGKPRKRTRRPAGLEIIAKDGYWHLDGTIRIRGQFERVRRSTKLEARPDTRDKALEIKRQYERTFLDEALYGIQPSLSVALAARRYLGLNDAQEQLPNQGKKLGAGDLQRLQRAVAKFEARQLDTISGEEWSRWALAENKGCAPPTIVRFMAPIKAFLRWCHGGNRKWLRQMPHIELPAVRREKHRKRRRVYDLSPELLVFLFSHAALHLRAQLYTQWSTGCRNISVLFQARLCDLILTPGRGQITFRDTKNGDDVTAHLHEQAAGVIAEYLDHRGRLDQREGPLFLTDRHRPYSSKGRQSGWGSENKTAWRRMRARAVKAKRREAARLRLAGDRTGARMLWGEAALLAQVTPHWLRHWFATHALASGMSLEAIAAQGGWRDYRSIQAYAHDVPEVRRRAIDNLPIGNQQRGRG